MTNNTTLDAAIEAALRAADMSTRPQSIHRKFSKALIAKLLEGMEPPIDKTNPFQRRDDKFEQGFNAAITEIRRRAGIEGGES